MLRLLNTTNGNDIRTELSNGADVADTHYLVMIGLLSLVVLLLIFGNTILLMNHLNKKKMLETVTRSNLLASPQGKKCYQFDL